MSRIHSLSLLLLLACGLWSMPVPAGVSQAETLMGAVQVEGDKRLKNLIVYLEPAIPGQVIAAPRKHRISQKGRTFKPALVVIHRGDTVQWLNDEDREIDHNVYSLNKVKPFDLGLHDRGAIVETTINREGRLTYFCSVHKRMEGKLVVLPSRYFTVLEGPGSFMIPDVPVGEWMLKAVIFHRRYKSEALKVSVGPQPIKDLIVKIARK